VSGSVVTVVQARTGSSRLPGKILQPLAGAPALVRLIERVKAAERSGVVVVATTTLPEDDVIEDLGEREGFLCFRGHATDLLDRHYKVARQLGAAHVVKIPSDCPLIDPAAIDQVIGCHLDEPQSYDYVSNLHPASWPDGFDVEVMTFAALETAWREATRDFEREHTTPFLWERKERFRIANVAFPDGFDLSRAYRFTLDYPEDYDLIAAVYRELYPLDPLFGLWDLLALAARRPQLMERNARYRGVNWYRHHLDDLRTVTAADTRVAEGA
jgi:spore coat polysaccharide biosynthesis protein SpsF